jgi:hypothetical protein
MLPTADGAVTTSVKVPFVLAGNEPSVHEIVPVAPTAGVEQLQPAGTLRLTNLTPAGKVSVSDTEAAAEGPPFEAMIVYVKFCAALTEPGPALETPKSACEPITMLKACVALPVPFVAVAFPVNVPAVVGVPLRTPAVLRVSPVGSVPDVTLKVGEPVAV